MKTLTSAQVKDQITVDDVSKSKGIFTARKGFFYTGGKSEEHLVEAILAAFPEATILTQGEVWKPFRGGASIKTQSHWFVTFTL